MENKQTAFAIDTSPPNSLDEHLEYLLTVHDHSSSQLPQPPISWGKKAREYFPPKDDLPKGFSDIQLVMKKLPSDKFPQLSALYDQMLEHCSNYSKDLEVFFPKPVRARCRYFTSGLDPPVPGEVLFKGYRVFSIITKPGNNYLVLFGYHNQFRVLDYFVEDHDGYSDFLRRIMKEVYYLT